MMAVRAYDDQRARWTEVDSARSAICSISARVKAGRLVDQNETELTVEYGSPALFRLLGGIITCRWFPITVTVTAIDNGDSADVEVVGSDRRGPYLWEVSIRRGDPSIGRRSFTGQLTSACDELRGSAEAHR